MQKNNFLLIIILIVTSFMASCNNDEVKKDLCEDIVCKNKGLCSGGICNCATGFEGDNCEFVINACPRVNTCSNAGRCISDNLETYTCDCLDNYEGENCEIEHPKAFITTWKTDNDGISDDNQVKIPIITSEDENFNQEIYNYNVDCNNDGIFEAENQKGEYICTYPQAGTYTIRITGDFPRIYFTEKEDNKKLLSVEQWGTQKWSSMHRAFYNCTNLVLNATDRPNLYNVISMMGMFQLAKSFNQDISNWDVSNVSNMSGIFLGAKSFNQDISNWDVSNVIDMNSMFCAADSFNQDISSWDVHNVIKMDAMFYDAKSFNQDISSWDVSSVKDMTIMFNSAISFNQDISSWDVSSVTDMRSMFYSAISFNQDISLWDVSNVTNMKLMFHSAESFNQDLSSWNVDNVTNCEAFSFIGSWTLPKPNFTNCTP